ncbi:MAG TPA: flagellar biosynthetic protein FliR [Candidatus Acidoferrales bacterium]|nr:flagellar biosynthetic protein FliR [Candidatus Acidoferrales bacterium]
MTAASLLVFARCTGFALRAPGFAHPSVPPPVRLALAALLALVIAPGVRATVGSEVALTVALVTEFLVGSAIGVAASLVYDCAYAGGRAVDDYVGVKAIAPNADLVAPSGFGRVWSLAYTGGFFLLGAYRLTVTALAASFVRLPPASVPQAHALAAFVAQLASTVALVAAGVAAPAVGLAFVAQIALGALSRTVPRFGSVTLAFPLAFAAALIATAAGVPALAQHVYEPLLALPVAP